MVKSQRAAVAFGLAAVLLWSTVATAFKLSLELLTPLQLLALASTVSWVFFMVAVVATGQLAAARQAVLLRWPKYTLIGLLNPTLYYWVLFIAYDLLPAQQAQSINYTWALMLALLSVPLLKQSLTKVDIVACLLGYAGVVVIASGGSLEGFQQSSILGVSLALVSTVVWALYWIINTKQQDSPLIAMLIGFSVATPVIWILCVWQSGWPQLSIQAMAGALWVGLFEMGVTFVLWLNAMRKAERVSPVANLIFLSPFLSLVFIQLFLGERIVLATFVGLTLIVVGTIAQQLYAKRSSNS